MNSYVGFGYILIYFDFSWNGNTKSFINYDATYLLTDLISPTYPVNSYKRWNNDSLSMFSGYYNMDIGVNYYNC